MQKVYSSRVLCRQPLSVSHHADDCYHAHSSEQTALAAVMQVKDALGVWNDVILEPGQVAVMFGQTATEATAGLLRPAVYRMVRHTKSCGYMRSS